MSPSTPSRSDQTNVEPPTSPSTTMTPSATPKSRDIRSVASMPSFQSFTSVQSLNSHGDMPDFDPLDLTHFANESIYYDFDNFQTPDLDPLSPSIYDLYGQISPQHHPMMTPELSGSVGSGTSLSAASQADGQSILTSQLGPHPPHHASFIASNIEGLGIAENQPPPQAAAQTPKPLSLTQPLPMGPVQSPDSAARRAKAAAQQPRVTKKPSKQTLKQRKSRANLAGGDVSSAAVPAAVPGAVASISMPSKSPEPSASSISSLSSAASGAGLPPAGPLQPVPAAKPSTAVNLASASASARPPAAGSMEAAASTPAVSPSSTARQAAFVRPARKDDPGSPVGFNSAAQQRLRGRAAASPAMRSPLRPGQQMVPGQADMRRQPRLPAAAAATALFTPSAPTPDLTRQNSMAAAAAAAAASASSQHPVTPLADRQIPRNSPSTILASVKTVSSHGDGSHAGSAGFGAAAPSPTPAARMHSSSKLVSSASDSSPAKGVWQQAPRAPIPLSQLPKPVLSPRKSASTSNMRRDSRRKSNKIIPEMSSSLNQFQVDLRPKKPAKAAAQRPSQLSLQGLPMSMPQHRTPPPPPPQNYFGMPEAPMPPGLPGGGPGGGPAGMPAHMAGLPPQSPMMVSGESGFMDAHGMGIHSHPMPGRTAQMLATNNIPGTPVQERVFQGPAQGPAQGLMQGHPHSRIPHSGTPHQGIPHQGPLDQDSMSQGPMHRASRAAMHPGSLDARSHSVQGLGHVAPSAHGPLQRRGVHPGVASQGSMQRAPQGIIAPHFAQSIAPHVSSTPPRPQTAPVFSDVEPNKVQPQGEPPQHVWELRPQQQKPQRRTNSRSNLASGQRPESSRAAAIQQARGQQQQLAYPTSHLEAMNAPQMQQRQLVQQQSHIQQAQHARSAQQAQQAQQTMSQQGQNHRLSQSQPVPIQSAHGQQSLSREPFGQHELGRTSPSVQGVHAPHLLRHSMPQLLQRPGESSAFISPEEAQDISITSEFMAQFINEDWGGSDIDVDGQWDFMDALETPI